MLLQKPSIFDQDISDISEFVKSIGETDYRTEQIWNGLYQKLWTDPQQFTNLPGSLRQTLSHSYSFDNLIPRNQLISKDGQTIKLLFQLSDQKMIETVLMNYQKRRSLCISTQAGCAMGCVFCATGQMGFLRHLSSGEIVEQVLYFARYLANNNDRLTNIVVMGMGEPFHNYDATLQAIDRLNHPKGFNFGARRFTISTVGIIPEIRKFALENRQVNLAISLHAADNSLRSALLPINKKYPLEDLFEACRFYVSTTKRRITFEWALINGVNDSLKQADLLADKISGLLCHVNLIVLNPTHAYTGKPSGEITAKDFKIKLEERGIPCTIRLRRGIEIQAGCGQLATKFTA
jgi:23S rRNA (adenine2503-C2)-methyltransferase